MKPNQNEKRLTTILGAKLRDHRRAKNMTQEQLAKKLGSCVSYVHQYETAKIVPPVYVYVRIMKKLGLNPGTEFKAVLDFIYRG